ncbi:39S ribosomal protein L18, mitochondrial [Hypanus sabinus]|uniref:39S ribosomal protein L18, mitochondrial n=1 Tax=Hypanus sabinus TaxID=79690 RepID=UPI0028C43B90|nr:39S ribosomal protein L18, mitochondrial [Hypanus sabinus]
MAAMAALRHGLAARAVAPATGIRMLAQASRPPQDADTKDNEIVGPRFLNRNPRNLERLALARKDKGWQTTWPRRDFWHRLWFHKSQHHISAGVDTPDGRTVLSASSGEWALKRHLASPRDGAAAQNVGRVLGQRCLRAGLGYLSFWALPGQMRNETMQLFRAAMKEAGVVLSEPRRVRGKH